MKTNPVRKNVLFVSNDAGILDAYKRDLDDEFDIVPALGEDRGLAEVYENGPYAVVVADLDSDQNNSMQFLSRINRIFPDTACILLTGQNDLESAIQAVNDGNIFRFLTKPFKLHILIKTIHAGIAQFSKNCREPEHVQEKASVFSIKKVLIVDDDPVIRSLLLGKLRTFDNLTVLTAENGKVARTILNIIKIDLVITDLEMPEMNGLELLSFMNRSHPQIPAIVLSWCITEELEREIIALGASRYMEKPLDIDALAEMVFEELSSGARGRIQGISTAAFLQLMEIEEKTCTLTVRSDHRVGYLYFLKGGLIAAETGNLRGEDAAYDIINWENSAIEIENVCRYKKKEISKPLMLILMESKRLEDEENPNDSHYRDKAVHM